jgi:hypothetical protein
VDLTADDDNDNDNDDAVILVSPSEARLARQDQERLERARHRRRQQESRDRQAALELQRREAEERRRRALAESDRLLAEQLAAEDLIRQRQAAGGGSSSSIAGPTHYRTRIPASHVAGAVPTRSRGRQLPGSWWSGALAGAGGSMEAQVYGRNLAELAQWLGDEALAEVLGLRRSGGHQQAPESYEDLLALSERIGVVKRGLSTGEINALPRIKHTGSSTDLTPSKDRDNDNHDCAICMTEFSQGDDVLLMPNCLHRFHAACIRPWLTENRTCPVCRVNVI